MDISRDYLCREIKTEVWISDFGTRFQGKNNKIVVGQPLSHLRPKNQQNTKKKKEKEIYKYISFLTIAMEPI